VLAQAQLLVVPSSYEPLGMVALEAFACGTPVVAADVGGLPEIVTDQTGWTCPVAIDDSTRLPADPAAYAADLAHTIVCALADATELGRRGEAAARVARQQFAWGPIAEETMAVYRSVI
jgi:starch synthase